MVASLLANPDLTEQFITKILPPLQDEQIFLLQLQARRKYCPSLPNDPVVARQYIRTNRFPHNYPEDSLA